MKKNINCSVLFKILILAACCISIILNIRIAPIKQTFLYFTVISNFCCLLFYLISLILYTKNKLEKNEKYYILKGLITINLTLTMAVYNLVLNETTIYENHLVACNFAHLVVPFMVIFDYILFGEKGHLKYKYTIFWGGFLILYTIICWIYGACGGVFADGSSFPYFYMNISEIGIIKAIFNCMFILIIFTIYGLFICKLDNLSYKYEKEKVKKYGK